MDKSTPINELGRKSEGSDADLVNNIIKTGNSNDSPLAKSKNIVNFTYSEYCDSSSTGNELFKKFSYDIKKFQITGIKK